MARVWRAHFDQSGYSDQPTMEDPINSGDVGEERVTQARPFGGALDQAGDINDVQICRVFRGGVPQATEEVISLVWHWTSPLIRI